MDVSFYIWNRKKCFYPKNIWILLPLCKFITHIKLLLLQQVCNVWLFFSAIVLFQEIQWCPFLYEKWNPTYQHGGIRLQSTVGSLTNYIAPTIIIWESCNTDLHLHAKFLARNYVSRSKTKIFWKTSMQPS